MTEESGRRGIEAEIERGHFARAAFLAEQAGLPDEEIRELRSRAIYQMAAQYRNVHGTRRLAQRYGFSRERVKEILEELASKAEKEQDKTLGPCYDYTTGRHVTFSEWKANFLKTWNRLPI